MNQGFCMESWVLEELDRELAAGAQDQPAAESPCQDDARTPTVHVDPQALAAAQKALAKKIHQDFPHPTADGTPAPPPARSQGALMRGTLERVVREMVCLLEERYDHPATELAERIRQRLLELQFVDFNGDSIIDAEESRELELYVEALVRTLERIRLEAVQQGLWGRPQAGSGAWFG